MYYFQKVSKDVNEQYPEENLFDVCVMIFMASPLCLAFGPQSLQGMLFTYF